MSGNQSEDSTKSRSGSKERTKRFIEKSVERAKKAFGRSRPRRRSEGDVDFDDPGSVEGSWRYGESAEAFEERGADWGYQDLQSDLSSEEDLQVVDPTFNQRYAFKGIGNARFRNYVVGLNQDKEGEIIYQLFTGKGTIRHLKMREATKEAVLDFLAEMELKQIDFPKEELRVIADPTKPIFTELSLCGEDGCLVCYPQEEKFCKVGEPGYEHWNSGEEEEDRNRKWKKDKRGGKKSKGRDSSPDPGTSRKESRKESRPLPPIPGKPDKKPEDRKESRRSKDKQEVKIKQEYEEEVDRDMSLMVEKLLEQKLAEQERKRKEKKRKARQEKDKDRKWREALWKPGRKNRSPSSPSSSSSSESSRDRGGMKAKHRKDREEKTDEDSGDGVKRVYTGTYKYDYGQTDEIEFPDTVFWDNVLKEVYETNQGNIPKANKFNLGHIKTRYYRIINALKDLQTGSSSADVVRRLHKAAVVLVLNNVAHRLLPQLFVESCLSPDERTLAESTYETWKGKPVEKLIEFLEKRIMRAGGEELQRRAANDFVQAEFNKKNVNVHQVASKLKTQIAHRLCASMTGFSGLSPALKKDRIELTAKQLFVEGLKTYRPAIYNKAITWSMLDSADVLQIAERIQNLFLVTDPETVSTIRFDKIDKQLEDVSRKLEVNANRTSERGGRGRARGSNPRGAGRGTRSRGRGKGTDSRGRGTHPRVEREPMALEFQGQDTPEPCFQCKGNHRAQDCTELREKQACFKCGSQDHYAKNCDRANTGTWSGDRGMGGGYKRTTFREPKPCRFCKEQGLGVQECKNKAIHCFYCGGPFPCPTHSKPR